MSISTSSPPRTSKEWGSIPAKNAASPAPSTVLSVQSVSSSRPESTYNHSSPSWRWYSSSSARSAEKTTLMAASPAGPASGTSGWKRKPIPS